MADKEVKAWFTSNGKHIPIFDGETKDDAIKRYTNNNTTQKAKKVKKLKVDQKGYANITHREAREVDKEDL